jgi:hypothetical protein
VNQPEHTRTPWKSAILTVAISLYLPFLLIGLLGFPHDRDCRRLWWNYLPLLPGLAPAYLLNSLADLALGDLKLRQIFPPYLINAWNQFAAFIHAGPESSRLLVPLFITLGLIALFAMASRLFGSTRPKRAALHTIVVLCAGASAALAYAMFLA